LKRPVELVHRHALYVGAAIVLTAFNLRPAVAGVGPVLPELQADLGLSGSLAAALTMLPVLGFGLLAGVAPRLAGRFGLEPALLVVSVVLGAALLGRVMGGTPALFLGTVLAGGAIAVANVLLPPLIKRDFAERSGTMMGIYSTTLSASAAVAAGTTVPLSALAGLGWRGGLGAWAVPAFLAALVWIPLARKRTRPPPAGPAPRRSLLGNALAWQVTGYFGIQALSFYATLAWLPSIYQANGFSAASSGFLLGLAGLVQLPVTLVLPHFASRARNQVVYIVVATALIGAGLLGVLQAPTAAPYLWVTLIGVGQGSCFALGLSLFVLRTRGVADAARLSAMAQGVGYVVAAFGPLLVGVLHDVTGSWTGPLLLLLLLVVPQLALGALSGRARVV
jgi:CP family cyanate transporter-like MFS transporter